MVRCTAMFWVVLPEYDWTSVKNFLHTRRNYIKYLNTAVFLNDNILFT
jgi:hypothetical protein